MHKIGKDENFIFRSLTKKIIRIQIFIIGYWQTIIDLDLREKFSKISTLSVGLKFV